MRGQQERLYFLIRRKGDRMKGGGPSLIQPGGVPCQQLLSGSTSGLALQECPGSVGGCGLGLGSTPRSLDRGRLGHKPRPERGEEPHVSSQALPLPHYCVWGENRPSNYGNLEPGPPGTRPHLLPEGSPGSSISTSCPNVPRALSSLIQAVSARRTRSLEADHLSGSGSPCFAFY